MVPGWGLIPLVLLSTAATVIASQAVISGSFSLSRQAIQLGLMPQLDMYQTSAQARGQIYIPQVNWLLLAAVLALVLGFKSSSALASAYGFAVTGTMTLTTVLAGAVMRGAWRWRWPTIGLVLVPIMTVDLALFSSNSMKIPSGGWFPLGHRARHVHDHDHLAHRPPIGAGAAGERDDAARCLSCHLRRGAGGPRFRHRGLSHHPHRARAADSAC